MVLTYSSEVQYIIVMARELSSVQTDMVLEKELRVLYLAGNRK